MDINEMTIGQAKELSKLFGNANEGSVQLAEPGKRVIAVLQRGNVATGIYSQDGEIGKLSSCSIIRRWGTENGLGELAANGPLENTKLDGCPDISFHIREAVFVMGCSDAW